MKLENIDVSKLQLANIPKFDKCPCELCDDGCFDRAGYEHHAECPRNRLKRPTVSQFDRYPQSHYQSTFVAARNSAGEPEDHRRQPFPPAAENEIPISFKHVPMSGLSAQREHFQPPPPGKHKPGSMAPKKQDDALSPKSGVPMETQSHYQSEYVEKPVAPIYLRSAKDVTKVASVQIADPKAAVASQTTSQLHFKPWQSSPAQPFAEMPTVAGYILFPDSSRRFTTSSGSTFVPFPNASQAKPILRPEQSGNLKLAGAMDMRTSYRDDFIPRQLPVPSARDASNQKQIEINVNHAYLRPPMDEISQTSSDFRPYPKHRPPLPADIKPFLSQINIRDSSTPAIKTSQYSSDYPGIDTSRYRRPTPAAPKDRQQPYVTPGEKMETTTVTHRDFPPLDVARLPRMQLVPSKGNLSVSLPHIPMESLTMSRSQFQPYELLESPRRYGDPNPSIYVPPSDKFQGTTTTGDAYKGRTGSRARPCVPEMKMLSQIGKQDHTSSYRMDYPSHGLTLCAAKAYAIAQQKLKIPKPMAVH